MASPRGNDQYTHCELDFLKDKAHITKAGINSAYIPQQIKKKKKLDEKLLHYVDSAYFSPKIIPW